MKYVLAPFRAIFKVYFGIVFFGTLLLQFPLYYIFTRWERTAICVHIMKRYFWSPLLQILLLVWVNHKGQKNFPKNGSFIICPNHTSYYDILFMYRVVPTNFLFMGKAELKKWPLMQVFFKNGKFDIAVDRKNSRDAARALNLSKQRLKEGSSMVIFPEGTIPENAPVLNRFKSGAFKLAIESQVPVVPVTFLNHWKLMSDPLNLIGPCRPGISRVIIHEPIQTAGLTEKDVLSLQQQVFETVEKELKQYTYPELKNYGKE